MIDCVSQVEDTLLWLRISDVPGSDLTPETV
jgi:hypothetical protein